MRIHLVHGIHTSTGDPVVRGLIPYLTAAPVVYPDYGWIAAVETKVANPIIVGVLGPYIQPDDILIGHSNGCAIIEDLLKAGVKARGIVLINAALQQNIALPECVQFAHVYSNPGDTITEAAQLAAEIGIVDPDWGQMGHAGYNGQDPRFSNIFCDRTPGMPPVSGHSDIFTPPKLPAWGPYIDNRIIAGLQLPHVA